MANNTLIAWTDHTANFWWGCMKVSAGCKNCYAEKTAKRRGKDVWGPPESTARDPKKGIWTDLRKWERQAAKGAFGKLGPGKPMLIFVGSMMDWAEDHPELDEIRERIWPLIRESPHLHFQMLTKRPERIRGLLPDDWGTGYPNVWLGTSVEDMRVAGRADHLRSIPAAVRFISYEPALGPLDDLDLQGIDWVIYGGESGPGHRPHDLAWPRGMRGKCSAERIAFFYKQSAAYRTEMGIELDGEIVREYPEPRPTGIAGAQTTAPGAVLIRGPVADLQAYEQIENRVRKGDLDALIARWECGRRLLAERGNRQRLPKGRLTELATALGRSKADLHNRMQFAEEHPTEEDVRLTFTRWGSWSEICARGLGARGADAAESADSRVLLPELAALADLKPHPRTYRNHPVGQLAHIEESIREHGFSRAVVVARDNTILDGHGSVLAAQRVGLKNIPVIRLDYDAMDVKALKVLAGDNEIANLAADDDRKLVEILKEINTRKGKLVGTGYDDKQLTSLIFTSTSREEFASEDDARLWAGLPVYERQPEPVRLVITFESEADRQRYADEHDVLVRKKAVGTWSAAWPNREKARPRDLFFEESGESPTAGAQTVRLVVYDVPRPVDEDRLKPTQIIVHDVPRPVDEDRPKPTQIRVLER